MHSGRDWGNTLAHLFNRSWKLLKGAPEGIRRSGALPATAPGPAVREAMGSGTEEPLDTPAPSFETPSVTHEMDPRTDGQATSTDGCVAVCDGEVLITNPVGGGLLPVLMPGDDVILTIDGHEVTKAVSVWAGQSVKVRPRNSAQPVRPFQINVEPDGMAAWLTLPALGPPGYRVLDTGPAHVVRLEAQALPGRQANPSPEEIEQALAVAGVVAGVDRSAILRALEVTGPTKVKVAAGQPVVPSQPGRIETAVRDPSTGDSVALAARVYPGQELARVIPPKLGQTGHDVMGRILEPEPVRDLRLVAGAGTMLTQDGTTAVATIVGRPGLFELEPGVFQVSVVPATELSGPLGPRPVPYQFEGDVVIHGDVHPGVTLHAGGWIWVRGSVQDAILQAGQGIRVDRTVQRSTLITRSARRMITTFLQQCNGILADLEQMQALADQIIHHPRYAELSRTRSFGQVMLLLAQNRFGYLRQCIHQCRQALTNLASLRTQIVDLEAVLNALEEQVYSGHLNSVDDLKQLTAGVRAATQRVAHVLGAGSVEAPILVHTLLWSQIDADGAVVVQGAGAEQTAVKARGKVQITNLRDSRVTAGTAIEIGVATASEPDKVNLEVSPGGHIHISLVTTPAQLRIGHWRYQLNPEPHGVYVQSDQDGRATITSGRQWKNGQATMLPVQARDTYHPLHES